MSYKEILQQHNTDLQGLIDKANALPDAGSGGGGGASVETCTLVVEDNTIAIAGMQYQSTLGEIAYIITDPMTPATGTYTVVCGTMVYILKSSSSKYPSLLENMTVSDRNSSLYVVTANAGETAKIVF